MVSLTPLRNQDYSHNVDVSKSERVKTRVQVVDVSIFNAAVIQRQPVEEAYKEESAKAV